MNTDKIGKTADNKDRDLNKVIRIHRRGEGHLGFMEVVGHEPATEGYRKRGGQWVEPKEAKPGSTKLYKASGLRGANERKWNEAAQGEHERGLEQAKRIERPRKPLVQGLVPQRMHGIERK